MKYITDDGMKFNSYTEAKSHEDSLLGKSQSKDFEEFLKDKLKVYKVSRYSEGSPCFIAVIANMQHEEYADLKAEALFGVKFKLSRDNDIVANWDISECSIDIINSVLKKMLGEEVKIDLPVYVFCAEKFNSHFYESIDEFDDESSGSFYLQKTRLLQ